MKRIVLSILLITILNHIDTNGQFLTKISDNTKKASEYFPREKVYLHTDKAYYFPGDVIWFKAYIVDASYSLPAQLSTELKVMMFSESDEIISEQLYKIENATTNGGIVLPKNIEEGVYTLAAYSNWMHNLPVEEVFRTEVIITKPYDHNYNLSVSTGRQVYTWSDTCQLSIQLSNNEKKIETETSLEYQLLEKETIIAEGTATTTNSSFVISLPEKTTSSTLFLKTTIEHYGKDLYSITPIKLTTPINNEYNSHKITFFPESNTFVHDIANKLAFFIQDGFGNPAQVTGAIHDSKDNIITEFSSDKYGLGSVSIALLDGEQYYAVINNSPLKFNLPEATSNVLLKYEGRTEVFHLFTLQKSDTLESTNLYAVLRGGEKIYWSDEIELKSHFDLRVPVKNLPDGPLHLTLFNESEELLGERSFFNESMKSILNAEIQISDDEAEVTISNIDKDTEDLITSVSLSLTPVNLANKRDNIVESLQIRSELNLPFNYPELDSIIINKDLLDLLMITSSSKGLSWTQILDITSVKNSFYPFDSFAGKILNDQNEPVLNAKVRIVLKNLKTIDRYTGADGTFTFAPLRITKESIENLSVEHSREEGKLNILTRKTFAEKLQEDVSEKLPLKIENEIKIISVKKSLTELDKNYYQYLQGDKNIYLSKTNNSDDGEPYYLEFLKTHTLLETIMFMKPYTISYGQIVFYSVQKSRYMYGGAIIVVNGVSYGRSITILETLNPEIVAKIKITTNPISLMRYSASGASGLIEITTRDNVRMSSAGKSITYTSRSEFLLDNLDDEDFNTINTTIYWNPDIVIEEDDENDYDFRVPITNEKYTCTLQGFDNLGRIVYLKLKMK